MQGHIEIARFRAKLQVYLYKPRTFSSQKRTTVGQDVRFVLLQVCFHKDFKSLGKFCEVTKAIRKKKDCKNCKILVKQLTLYLP